MNKEIKTTLIDLGKLYKQLPRKKKKEVKLQIIRALKRSERLLKGLKFE